MRPLVPLASACVLACVAVGAATAQLKKVASPEGDWAFTTTTLRSDCVLTGEMTVIKTRDNAFTCTFKAEWACKVNQPRTVHTEQTCIATQSGADFVVTSKIAKVIKVEPVTLTDWMRKYYAPDNFEVTINRSGDAMNGMFRSYDSAPVKFRRKLDLIS